MRILCWLPSTTNYIGHVAYRGGGLKRKPASSSNCATPIVIRSPYAGPTICTPRGNPSELCIDSDYFESRMRMMKNGVIDRPGFTKWWDGHKADVFDPRFVEYVEKKLRGQSTRILPSFSQR